MSTAKFINPETMAKPPGYTHVVEITAPGRLIYIAGQLGFDRAGKLAGGAGDFRAQAVQAFDNLRSALTAVGATFADIVKINSYITDMGHLPIFREVRDQFVNTAAPPASTLVGVTSLAVQGALFEIEAIAMLRN